MPTAKCKISSRSSGLEIRFALKEALEEKGYKRIALLGLSSLLRISITDACAIFEGRRPSIDAIRAIYFFIDKAPALPKPWVIPAQPSSTFARVRWSMRREFNDLEIFAGALIAFFCFWGFVYLVFILPEFLGGLL